MFVKLRFQTGSFYDPETGFRISGDKVKEMGKVGALSRQWLNGGGLAICDAPVIDSSGGIPSAQPKPNFTPSEVEDKVDTRDIAIQLLEDNSIDTLKKMADEMKIKGRHVMGPNTLAKRIAEKQAKK
jgi:hypothetical protein